MVMERRRSMTHRCHEVGEIRKGPWKAEEDEVLINHVKKYGPRDWSSIRSKGLLQRTGKSCRLRWVNKLRPNLKSGVKFTAEEERTVIELQAQFGNKWAKIATYLSGRTDNDVKNFWSSRQKRLARILQTSATPPSSSKPHKNSKEVKAPKFHGGSVVSAESSSQTQKFTSSMEDDTVKSLSCSSSHNGVSNARKIVPLPDLVYPSILTYDHIPFQLDYEIKPRVEPQSVISFPAFPKLQPDFTLPLESHEFMTIFGEPNFLDIFEYASDPPQLPIASSFVGTDTSSQMVGDEENHFAVAPNIFSDDFPPIHMFDQIESLPSPSEWS